MHAKHEGNTLSDPNVCKTLGKSQAADFPARPGQLPHSHIGELKCMQNTIGAQSDRRGRVYARQQGDLR